MKLLSTVIAFLVLGLAAAAGTVPDSATSTGPGENDNSGAALRGTAGEGRALGYGEYYRYDHKACRDKNYGQGKEGYDYTRYYNYSFGQCKDKCSSEGSCKQFEYYSNNRACEIWYNYYNRYEDKYGFYCYVKKY